MTMMKLSLAAAAVLMTASVAVAEEPQTAEAPKQKKICKSEKITGSLTRVRRVCMTESEWAQLNEDNRKNLNDFVRQAGNAQGPGAGTTGAAN